MPAIVTPTSLDMAGVKERLQATTPIPKALAMGTIVRPIVPRPISPNVRPRSPPPSLYSSLFHLPRRRSRTFSGMRLSNASMRPKASSTTAPALPPGQLETCMPDAFAASTSIVLNPAPARITSLSLPPARASAFTLVLLTTSTSARDFAMASLSEPATTSG